MLPSGTDLKSVKQKLEQHTSTSSPTDVCALIYALETSFQVTTADMVALTSLRWSPLINCLPRPQMERERGGWSTLHDLSVLSAQPLGLGSPSPLLTLFPPLLLLLLHILVSSDPSLLPPSLPPSRRVEEGTSGSGKWLPWQRCPAIPLRCGWECVTPSPGWTSPCRWRTTSLSPTAGSTSR